ncbi:p-hydroxybenzoic acid efflux pump subunit AaeB [Bradyrhizobium ivorense]|uniref:p-hydroxybenzoic acid efflux pump subunit AaeB n=1 Tax=Bradyrhizobium ivorense TaxID=2511166 RepID=A0A508TGB1_9BRAD|nr:FUSC family protein [Bradyrhizobium ivorense]VIO73087.1 p-hydroxybenzoic acid efflux pump subunit AaeB [Bradyrhizobium ivorense]
MTVVATTTEQRLTIAKIPVGAWSFAIRIWLATILALFVSFWLQLESPTTAALTVAILAEPTRGQALDKARWRLLATVVGVTASIAITGLFSQARDLILAAFAVWLGVCVFAAKLLDGYRAYAAVLSGYTVAFIATQQIDNPQHVFESGMARGAAIVVGVLSIAVVNTLMSAPDRRSHLITQLAAIHRRVRLCASAALRGEPGDSKTFLSLLREIVFLRPEIASVAPESSSGAVGSAAARSTAVSLIAELQAARSLSNGRAHGAGAETEILARSEVLLRGEQVSQDLLALSSAKWPRRLWRAPLYRSYRIAAESAVRAALWLAITSAFYVWAGWPAASVSLSFVTMMIGLGATTPKPRAFTAIALVAAPIAIVLTGILEFFILNGADDFPLLAIGLAPFVIGAALLVTSSNLLWSSLGRAILPFIMLLLAPSNPQTYNPQAFLFTSVFIIAAAALLLATQTLIPPLSDDKRRMQLLAEARSELQELSFKNGEAPEEAMLRNASRLGQFLSAGGSEDSEALAEMVSCFDQSTMMRRDGSKLT